jgi:ABC-type transporter Mla subunit MlaD
MAVAQTELPDRAAAGSSASERLVDQLADRIGGLGVELADVAGNLQEVAGRVSGQSDRFGHLRKSAETMVSATRSRPPRRRCKRRPRPRPARSRSRARWWKPRSGISPN